ncbi:MAG TPA: stage II sporulation protein M, partial [Janthinobacterium sp.]|nr:stage II sporulation protein M [Janthinobacterium sp.]
MKQKQFEEQNAALWSQIAAILQGDAAHAAALPQLYRRLCQCLALSGQRGYSPALTDYLQAMVADCHRRLYGSAAERPRGLLRLLMRDFPRRVRGEWRLLLLAALALWGVAVGVGLLVWLQPWWAYSFSSPAELEGYRQMYQPGRIRVGRGNEGDILMFGHYVWNNISICFRTFAGGIAGGVPALLSLTFNGMQMGLVASWLSREAATHQTFWPFVITPSSFEITGLMLSGMAGMRLGLALIHPGRRSRRQALYGASQAMYPVLVGASLMTLLAAFFEA